jgi:hypothetical protein
MPWDVSKSESSVEILQMQRGIGGRVNRTGPNKRDANN